MDTLTLYVKDKKLSTNAAFESECRFISCNTSYNIKVNFDSEWDGLKKTVRLMYKSNNDNRIARDMELDDNNTTCKIPYELLPTRGILYIGVYSEDTAATNTVRFWIKDSAKDLGSTFNGDNEPGVVWHDHDNLSLLDLFSKQGEVLAYDGRQLVDERALKIYETLNDLYSDYASPTLCYVVTNRTEFVPIELEVGVRYGGNADFKDREMLYVDPLLVGFFPCEPFTVTTELVQVEPHVDRYTNHTFATDGSTWFKFSTYRNTYGCVYNNTNSTITLDGIEYPFHGWNVFNGEEVHQLNPTTNETDIMYFKWLIDVKFLTDDNFTDLQKILSTTPAYEGGRKGLYVYNGLMYQHLTQYMSNIQIGTNSALERSHSHPNKGLLDSLTEDSLSGGMPVAYINDAGELIFEIGGSIKGAEINKRGELEVELI